MEGNPYPFPNDEVEKGRLDAIQDFIRGLIRGNVISPIVKDPRQIGKKNSSRQATLRRKKWT